jgi:hypothetical protein
VVLCCFSYLPAEVPPAASFSSRFGHLHSQRFRITDRIQLNIEYNSRGAVTTAQIVSPEYGKRDITPHRNMDSGTVDEALEVIAPGIVGDRSGQTIVALVSRNTLVQKTFRGCRLSRHYLTNANREETVVATLVASRTCLSDDDAAGALEERFGPPEYEQFLAQGNIDLGVQYGRDGAAMRVDLDPRKHLPAGSSDIEMLNVNVVEQLINQIAPREEMAYPRTGVSTNGSYTDEFVTAGKVLIIRRYRDNARVHASITWR